MVKNNTVRKFLEISEKYSENMAIFRKENCITYLQLFQITKAFAAIFTKRNFEKILIAAPAGEYAYAAMLASLASNATYAPLNLLSSLEKKQRILEIFQPDVIIGNQEEIDALCGDDSIYETLSIENMKVSSALYKDADFQIAPSNRPAYVIFTSGSTGVPKGVVVGRQALDHYVEWMAERLSITPQDRVSQYANIAFDLSVMEIYGALCAGASLCPIESFFDRMRPAQMIAAKQISVWISVPSLVNLMQQSNELTFQNLKTVKQFVFCGEALLVSQARALKQILPDSKILNTYGPTETTVSVTEVEVTEELLQDTPFPSVTLGKPIEDMTLSLEGADPDDGEIVITGPQLADGYLNNPAATQAAFREVQTHQGLVLGYFTGDRGVRINGTIYFAERLDFQIKHKGYRIETEEIYSALSGIGYNNSCVLYIKKKIVVVLEMSQIPDSNLIRKELSNALEPYAIPDVILNITTFPRNDNGKIDRKKIENIIMEKI
ncbi:Long-chain-fatty-acid--CoA ligase [Acetobacter malorum]|uniref:Long-chain-fatty-acid--CoA ligase n=1 Tax=Acetobacter malorum TaxID=178901 RepID=A0A087PSI2_9PROT|nr:AMP-binding protein [Acetobacter malorum]KFL90335.1 Long-chain-fatty-acid--CoA ligase [Acetobacter malorum]OAG77770.1 Long-chain-fatty-acid--CoA ligase [Acetobacter malorum]